MDQSILQFVLWLSAAGLAFVYIKRRRARKASE